VSFVWCFACRDLGGSLVSVMWVFLFLAVWVVSLVLVFIFMLFLLLGVLSVLFVWCFGGGFLSSLFLCVLLVPCVFFCFWFSSWLLSLCFSLLCLVFLGFVWAR